MIKMIVLLFAACVISACKHSIDAKALYGNWKYVKIDKPRSDDLSDTVTTAELTSNAPYISFTSKNELKIYWGGKLLSHGTFMISDANINYTEQLPDGKTRTFPFWVSKLDANSIVFETLDKNGSRVTALRR